jgi:hypothetical protein
VADALTTYAVKKVAGEINDFKGDELADALSYSKNNLISKKTGLS